MSSIAHIKSSQSSTGQILRQLNTAARPGSRCGRISTAGVQMMSAVDVERAGRDLDDVKKLEHYINVTMLFLEDEDHVSSERFLVKVCLSVLPFNRHACACSL